MGIEKMDLLSESPNVSIFNEDGNKQYLEEFYL